MEQTKTNPQKPYDVEPNVEAALAYMVTPISGIAIFMLEKENKFVRFHAMQSILFGITAFAFWSMASTLTAVLVGFFLLPLVSMGCAALWLFLMWKAFNNEEFELPVLGKIAKDQVYK